MKIGSLGVIYGHILFSLSSTIHPLSLHWGLGLRSGLNPFFLKYNYYYSENQAKISHVIGKAGEGTAL